MRMKNGSYGFMKNSLSSKDDAQLAPVYVVMTSSPQQRGKITVPCKATKPLATWLQKTLHLSYASSPGSSHRE